MSLSFPYLIFSALLGIIILLYSSYFKSIVNSSVTYVIVMPRFIWRHIDSSFLRVARLNWYTLIALLVMWILLFKTEIGLDIVEEYASTIDISKSWWKIGGSLGSLFLTSFLFSLAIWAIPFFLITGKQMNSHLSKPTAYYLSTKLKNYLAMLPLCMIGAAFLLHNIMVEQNNDAKKDLSEIAINFTGLVIFTLSVFLFPRILFMINKLWKKSTFKLKSNTVFSENPYINKLIWNILCNTLLIVLTSFLLLEYSDSENVTYIISVFIFISSLLTFYFFYYSDDSQKDADIIKEKVNGLFDDNNKKNSRLFFFLIAGLIASFVLYYIFVPSLSGTNSLYVLIIVLGFHIITLNYLRNLFQNRVGLVRAIALVLILSYFIVPFLPSSRQFNITVEDKACDKILEDALTDRINKMPDSTSNIFIVCGMGGGSRAAYITSNVLMKLENEYPGFLSQTLCYSSVSGSSPGIYHYLKSTENSRRTVSFLAKIYQRNYNSSGLFGLLLGDYLEKFFGFILTKLISLIRNEEPKNGYFDRNVKIRDEYEDALAQGDSTYEIGWGMKTFYRGNDAQQTDNYNTYFDSKNPAAPIHLINTFEVNSGRRSVLSPYCVKDPGMFPNAILPLQSEDALTIHGISYIEATNLSELFPLLSAASTVGDNKNNQYVDGGYFENYGLTTAMDLYEYLIKNNSKLEKRLKILLIKNSLQEVNTDKTSIQLFAPLVGVMNAPFTGHANHMQKSIDYRFDGRNKFYTIAFNAKKNGVPLTRALTLKHINSMNKYIKESVVNDKLDTFIITQ